MKKSKLLNFISKYHLGGEVDSVIWKVENNEIFTRYISDDSFLLAEITMKNVTDPITVNGKEMNGEIANLGVYYTTTLIGFLNLLEDDVSLNLKSAFRKEEEVYYLIDIKDADSNSINYLLVVPSCIRDVPKTISDLPEVDLRLIFDDLFKKKFIKGVKLLPDSETFTIITSDNEVKVVIGHEVVNTNRIELRPSIQGDIKNIKNVSFSSTFLKEILIANSEISTVVLNVSEKGLATVEIETDDFDAKYYMVGLP